MNIKTQKGAKISESTTSSVLNTVLKLVFILVTALCGAWPWKSAGNSKSHLKIQHTEDTSLSFFTCTMEPGRATSEILKEQKRFEPNNLNEHLSHTSHF